ncbi:MAG: FecR domain-containing protein [Bacteroidales bacterium]|nr:FecR domain-containing protein [Bacteroidales bacterium]
MFTRNKTDWNLLAKYMAGEAGEKEVREVMDWIGKNPGNQSLYNEIKTDWNKMDMMNKRFDVDNAWNKLQSRILDKKEIVLPDEIQESRKSVNRFPAFLRIAASFLLLAAVGAVLLFVTSQTRTVSVATSFNEKGKEISLPDGSVIILNSASSVSYSNQFGKKSREIDLKGEAYFEVTPDKHKPFVIYANNAQIKVLGTSFNVDANDAKNKVEVYVTSGVVELSEMTDRNNKVLLHPGNAGMINNRNVSVTSKGDANCLAWKTGDLTFHATRLNDVAAVLNEIYNVRIVIREPGIDTTRIEGSYQNDPLDHILQIICTQNHLKIAKSDDTIYLSR